MNRQRRYLSYMLRLWPTSNGENEIWRASLESPGSGQRRGFASLRDLFEFLETQAEPQDKGGYEPARHGGEGGDAARSF